MTTVDDFEVDDRLAAHLRRTLHAVAETITNDDLAESSRGAPFQPPHKTYRRRLVLAGAAAGIVAGGLLLTQPFGSHETTAWAADALAVAESAPRLLVTADGWEVTRADEFSIEDGEMTFAGPDGQELSLAWGTDDSGGYHDRLDEWSNDAQRLNDTTVAGHQAAVFQTGSPQQAHFVVLWPERHYGVEARGDFPDLNAFIDIAATIEPVDVDTWLSAMPPTVVKAESRAAAVQQMLADIPLPAGLDTSSLAGDGSVTDRYQLGAHVTGPIACAWIEQWVDATRTGDTQAAQEAIDAMATSHNWDILLEMETQGGWSHVVWELADAIATDGTIDGGLPDMPVADNYVQGLGCDTRS